MREILELFKFLDFIYALVSLPSLLVLVYFSSFVGVENLEEMSYWLTLHYQGAKYKAHLILNVPEFAVILSDYLCIIIIDNELSYPSDKIGQCVSRGT